MTTIGIVAEWNPFHNGHQHLIESIRRDAPEACIVSAMSGSFCQRGEAACLDKWQRAELALAAGVDVVLELAQVYATASLETFARGGVATLAAFAPLDALYCGSESGDAAALAALAAYLTRHRADYEAAIHAASQAGASYAQASQDFCARAGFSFASGKDCPNDRLALQYRLALADAVPLHLVRRGVAHDASAPQSRFLSASAIRARLDGDLTALAPYLPASSYERISAWRAAGQALPDMGKLFAAAKLLACSLSADDIAARLAIRDGWAHRFLETLLAADSLEAWLTQAQTRHYSRARCQRLLLALLSPAPAAPEAPPYVRVLGFNARGRALIKARSGRTPLLVNVARDSRVLPPEAQAVLRIDIQRQNLADALSGRAIRQRDYLEPPRIFS
ncbi:MAG: nucleotidyltransferase family protein [Peptococcaceae bacterium]|nr:nucleotidyltransferase family protein [Peptococcaceae bacterium]